MGDWALSALGTISAEERCLSGLNLAGAVAFDVGGFVGDHTLFLAERVGLAGRVITFEPHPANQATIRERVARAHLTNVEVCPAAIGRVSGSLEFVYPADLGLGSADPQIKARLITEACGAPVNFPARVLDREIAAGRLPDPDFVKIDVEGLEHDVLVGMSATVSRCRPVIFVELHAASDAQERANYRRVVTWLLVRNYGVTHVESGRVLRTADDATECYAGQHLYCVPDVGYSQPCSRPSGLAPVGGWTWVVAMTAGSSLATGLRFARSSADLPRLSCQNGARRACLSTLPAPDFGRGSALISIARGTL